MSFWGSLFGGSNPNLNTAIGQTGQIGGWATGQGQSNIGKATGFWNSILSGDATKTAQALAPEISADKKSTQQDQKTTAMLGGRTGGTAASNAASSDKIHSDITNLIGSLTGSSASSLASTGTSLLGTGLGAINDSAGLSQERMQNWSDSILGLGTTTAAGAGLGYALGKI